MNVNRAVIASDGAGNGAVLFWEGADFEHEIGSEYFDELSDLGLDDAPHGLRIWEGRYVYTNCSGETDEGYYSVPKGKFRELNDTEWEHMKRGKNPLTGK